MRRSGGSVTVSRVCDRGPPTTGHGQRWEAESRRSGAEPRAAAVTCMCLWILQSSMFSCFQFFGPDFSWDFLSLRPGAPRCHWGTATPAVTRVHTYLGRYPCAMRPIRAITTNTCTYIRQTRRRNACISHESLRDSDTTSSWGCMLRPPPNGCRSLTVGDSEELRCCSI